MFSKDLIFISDKTLPKHQIDLTDLRLIFGFKVTNATGHLIHWELVKDKEGRITEIIIHE